MDFVDAPAAIVATFLQYVLVQHGDENKSAASVATELGATKHVEALSDILARLPAAETALDTAVPCPERNGNATEGAARHKKKNKQQKLILRTSGNFIVASQQVNFAQVFAKTDESCAKSNLVAGKRAFPSAGSGFLYTAGRHCGKSTNAPSAPHGGDDSRHRSRTSGGGKIRAEDDYKHYLSELASDSTTVGDRDRSVTARQRVCALTAPRASLNRGDYTLLNNKAWFDCRVSLVTSDTAQTFLNYIRDAWPCSLKHTADFTAVQLEAYSNLHRSAGNSKEANAKRKDREEVSQGRVPHAPEPDAATQLKLLEAHLQAEDGALTPHAAVHTKKVKKSMFPTDTQALNAVLKKGKGARQQGARDAGDEAKEKVFQHVYRARKLPHLQRNDEVTKPGLIVHPDPALCLGSTPDALVCRGAKRAFVVVTKTHSKQEWKKFQAAVTTEQARLLQTQCEGDAEALEDVTGGQRAAALTKARSVVLKTWRAGWTTQCQHHMLCAKVDTCDLLLCKADAPTATASYALLRVTADLHWQARMTYYAHLFDRHFRKSFPELYGLRLLCSSANCPDLKSDTGVLRRPKQETTKVSACKYKFQHAYAPDTTCLCEPACAAGGAGGGGKAGACRSAASTGGTGDATPVRVQPPEEGPGIYVAWEGGDGFPTHTGHDPEEEEADGPKVCASSSQVDKVITDKQWRLHARDHKKNGKGVHDIVREIEQDHGTSVPTRLVRNKIVPEAEQRLASLREKHIHQAANPGLVGIVTASRRDLLLELFEMQDAAVTSRHVKRAESGEAGKRASAAYLEFSPPFADGTDREHFNITGAVGRVGKLGWCVAEDWIRKGKGPPRTEDSVFEARPEFTRDDGCWELEAVYWAHSADIDVCTYNGVAAATDCTFKVDTKGGIYQVSDSVRAGVCVCVTCRGEGEQAGVGVWACAFLQPVPRV